MINVDRAWYYARSCGQAPPRGEARHKLFIICRRLAGGDDSAVPYLLQAAPESPAEDKFSLGNRLIRTVRRAKLKPYGTYPEIREPDGAQAFRADLCLRGYGAEGALDT